MTKFAWVAAALALMIVSVPARAEPGEWQRLGTAGDWKNTLAGVAVNDRLYSVETDGNLYVTDLGTGKWSQLGKTDFAKTRFMFPVGGSLYTIETGGSLYRVSTADGSWERVGKEGDWDGTIAGTAFNGMIYTVEKDGTLYETDPATGRWKAIGKADFATTRFLFGAGKNLYSIETDGSLYRISPADGTWVQVGKAAAWKATISGAIVDDRLYTVETGGALYETDLATGEWRMLGKPDFARTTHMFGGGGRVFTIENDGSLYRVNVK